MNNTISITHTSALVQLIANRQVELALTDDDLAAALGFERSITVTMIKSGTIKFPLTKIPALANAL